MDNASLVEVLWSVGAGLGLLCNLSLLRVTVRDMTLLRRAHKNGPRTLVARGNRRNEVFRVIAQALFLAFGLVSMFTPPTAHHDGVDGAPVNLLGLLLAVILVYFEVQLVWSALQDLRERRELISLVDALEEERDAHVRRTQA